METITFDADGTTAIKDNSANVHIFNDKQLFINTVFPIDSNTCVAMIGGMCHRPERIGTVAIEWLDDE
eukprot:10606731-Ditylum_brightwellii.AAC.1